MEFLLEGRCAMRYFTDLRAVFRAIDGCQRSYNWLLTDLSYCWLDRSADRPPPFPDNAPQWLTGEELSKLVTEYEIQFVWAVLSGFSPSVAIDLSRLAVVPYADGNRGLWIGQSRIQHPLAEVEIVCWDSTSTLLLCRDKTIGESFRHYFPEAVDLGEYNRLRETRRYT